MIRAGFFSATLTAGVLLGTLSLTAQAQDAPEVHGRKWKPLPDLSHIVVTVEKGYNGHPLENAAVIFHAVRNGSNDGNLEIKTDIDGRAVMDLIEVGSHVTVQVLAPGFATFAKDFDVTEANQEFLVKLQRPRAQVSIYQDNDGKASQVQPGVQEHVVHKPTAAATTTTVAAPAGTTTTTTTTGAATVTPSTTSDGSSK